MDPQPQLPPGIVVLQLAYDTKSGGLQMVGPVNDLPFCLMVLERAKLEIWEHHKKNADRPKVIAPPAGMPNLRMNGHG